MSKIPIEDCCNIIFEQPLVVELKYYCIVSILTITKQLRIFKRPRIKLKQVTTAYYGHDTRQVNINKGGQIVPLISDKVSVISCRVTDTYRRAV